MGSALIAGDWSSSATHSSRQWCGTSTCQTNLSGLKCWRQCDLTSVDCLWWLASAAPKTSSHQSLGSPGLWCALTLGSLWNGRLGPALWSSESRYPNSGTYPKACSAWLTFGLEECREQNLTATWWLSCWKHPWSSWLARRPILASLQESLGVGGSLRPQIL